MKYSNLKKNFKANETLVCTICVLCRSTVTVLLWEFVLNLRGNLPQSMINKAGWGIETSREALRTISNAACLLNHCTYSQACEVMRINFDSCADKKNWVPRSGKKLNSAQWTKLHPAQRKKLNLAQWEKKNWFLHREKDWILSRGRKLNPAQKKKLNLAQWEKNWILYREKEWILSRGKQLNLAQCEQNWILCRLKFFR